MFLVGNVADNVSKTANFFKKKRTGRDSEEHKIETLEEKTKRLITDDNFQWVRFQEELRENGIVTNYSIEIYFYHYIRLREAEVEIDRCVQQYEDSQKTSAESMKNFHNDRMDSRARAA